MGKPVKRQPWKVYLAQAQLEPKYLANTNPQPAPESVRVAVRENGEKIRLFAELDSKS